MRSGFSANAYPFGAVAAVSMFNPSSFAAFRRMPAAPVEAGTQNAPAGMAFPSAAKPDFSHRTFSPP